MMLNIILLALLGGVMSLIGGLLVLAFKDKVEHLSLEMTAFAAGVMIAVATVDLLPEGFEDMDAHPIAMMMLIGIVVLFFLERTSTWFHHHHESHERRVSIPAIWLGDTIHNFIDGVAIASTYLINPTLGIATTIAVAAHELPQEIADFLIYVRSGMSRGKTLALNLLSSLATIAGAIGVYIFRDPLAGTEKYLLGFTAGMFCYIALADLIPELHHERKRTDVIRQSVSFVSGITMVIVSGILFGH